MATISRTGISNTNTIDAEHITRIIDALDGSEATEVVASGSFSGSFTGSFVGDGTNLSGVTAEWDGTHNGDAQITGSLVVTGNVTASGTISNVDTTHITASGNILATGTVTGATLTGTLSTAAQPNITSVGTLTTLNTSGNATASGNISSSAYVYADRYVVSQRSVLLYHEGSDEVRVGHTGDNFKVNGSTIMLNANVTASGVVSASAGFVGDLNGTAQAASAATNATNVNITAESSAANFYVHFGSATSGYDGVNIQSNFTFNPSTKTLTSPILSATTVGATQGTFTNVSASANVSASSVHAAELTASMVTTTRNIVADFSSSGGSAPKLVTPAGDNQGNATTLGVSDMYAVIWVSSESASAGVKLPRISLVIAQYGNITIDIFEIGGAAFKLYPAANDRFYPLSDNEAEVVAQNGHVRLIAYDDTGWRGFTTQVIS